MNSDFKIAGQQQSQLDNKDLHIPIKDDGTLYQISDLNYEQQKIAFAVMTKIIHWMKLPFKHQLQHEYTFQSLYMTIFGKAGSGKSFLIKTLITMVKQLSQVNNSVIVCGPTGTYLCNKTYVLFLAILLT